MKDKLIKSAGISIAGAVLATLVMLTPEISGWILNGTAIDWRPAVNAGFTGLMGWLVNTLRVFLNNQE